MERDINEQCKVINGVIVLWAKALEGPNNSAQKFQREDTSDVRAGTWGKLTLWQMALC